MTFLILDDHDIIRAGVKNILLGLYPSSTVNATANEKDFLALLKTTSPDLIIMDVRIPELDTPSMMEFIHSHNPKQKVIIFSMSAENIYAPRFLKAGAMGFVSKSSDITEVERAITLALSNKHYMSSNLTEMVVLGNSVAMNPFEKLTAREFDIVVELMKGNGVNAICKTYNISSSTVASVKASAFKKLMVNSFADLLVIGRLYNLQEIQ